MPKILVITNPAHDVTTAYLEAWTSRIIDKLREADDIKIIELNGDEANRIALEKAIADYQPRLVLINGHGDHDTVTGFNNEILVRCDDNEGCLANRLVHALSCKTGVTLGPRCIEVGGLAYIGYTENFGFYHLDGQTRDQRLTDQLAAIALDPAFEAIQALVEGDTAENALRRSQNGNKAALRFLSACDKTAMVESIFRVVWRNFTSQVQLGDGAARF
jgi:hypothetical protein